jgi:hypothetical protein
MLVLSQISVLHESSAPRFRGDLFGGRCRLVVSNFFSFLFRETDFEISLMTTERTGGLC